MTELMLNNSFIYVVVVDVVVVVVVVYNRTVRGCPQDFIAFCE